MRISVLTALAAGGFAAVTISEAGLAVAAPTGSGNAQNTVNSLQAAGYDVTVDRIGHGSLDQCTVRGVRYGEEITERRTDSTDAGSRSIDTVVHRPVFVSVKC